MNNFLEYIESSFKNMKETESLYKYKQKLIAEMTERANELVATGLRDDKIIAQIIMEEYPDIAGEYKKQQKIKKQSRSFFRKGAAASVGAVGGVFALVVVFLLVSFITNAWAKTWLILVGGIFVGLIAVMVLLAGKMTKKKGRLTIPARLLCFISVILFAVLWFLIMKVGFNVNSSWISFLLMVPLGMVLDVVLTMLLNKKTGILSLVFYLPVIFTLLYVTLGIAGIMPWHPGWILILVGILADLAIVLVRLLKGTKEQEEEDMSWSED